MPARWDGRCALFLLSVCLSSTAGSATLVMVQFFKYHGIGNDFIVVDRLSGGAPLDPVVVRLLCARHQGVGADGILSIWPDVIADARMQVQNADGSEAETCGNGLRCVARFLHDEGKVADQRAVIVLRDGAGVHKCERMTSERIRVGMGPPVWRHPDVPYGDVDLQVAETVIRARCLVLGNPHAVVFVEDTELEPWSRRFGRDLETHPVFPHRANVSFAAKTDAGFRVVVHERGVGITLACASGACAVAAAATARGVWPVGEPMQIELPGGVLTIDVDAEGQLRQEGEAVRVFTGEVEL